MADNIKTVIIRQGQANTVRSVVVNQGLKGDVGPAGPQGPQGAPGTPGPQGPAKDINVEMITLTTTDIVNKSISLARTPDEPETIELTPIGGVTQVYGVDYIYIDGNISWGGLGLDGVLEETEQIIVRYQVLV